MDNEKEIARLLPEKKNNTDKPSEDGYDSWYSEDKGFDKALTSTASHLVGKVASKEEIAEKIYNAVYQDKKPRQEMGARLECLALAEIVRKEFFIFKKEK